DRDSRRRYLGTSKRCHQRPERHDHREEDDELVRAREWTAGDGETARDEQRHQEERDARRDRLQGAGRAGHGRRVYLARRLSKRRERRRPRWLRVEEQGMESIRRAATIEAEKHGEGAEG